MEDRASTAVETVVAWHAALNQADVAKVLSRSTSDVEVGGPRGTGRGAEILRDWVERARIQIEVRRMFGREDVVVVAQAARWRLADGQLAEPQDVASVFWIQAGRVARVIRYPDLSSALQAGGLGETDEQL